MKNELGFNWHPSFVMHIDLNSCFATIEQQANPLLRGKPIAVAAYDSPNGCILAPSVEAKRVGVKTGMRVKDGKVLCPGLVILSSDPWKYRNVHLALKKLLSEYTPDVIPKSIDEFILDFSNFQFPISNEFKNFQFDNSKTNWQMETGDWRFNKSRNLERTDLMHKIAKEIKFRIKSEIGDWLTVSIGVSTNRFLAKLASNLQKPDGLIEINKENYLDVYDKLKLTDLPYIKSRNAIRLAGIGIYTVRDFYESPLWKLKSAFESINGYYWYTRLRGFEVDDTLFGRRSYGNSYALPKPLSSAQELAPILSKLVTKMCARFRKAGYKVRGVHLAISYRDGSFWHKGESLEGSLFDTRDIYKKVVKILLKSPFVKPVRELAVSSFNLTKENNLQRQNSEGCFRWNISKYYLFGCGINSRQTILFQRFNYGIYGEKWSRAKSSYPRYKRG